MSTYEERAAEARREMADEDQWETVPAATGPPRRLAAQVVIRLDTETADRGRKLGDAHGMPYTALLRDWLEERIRHEWDALERVSRGRGGRVVIRPVEEGGWEVYRLGTDSDGRIGLYQHLDKAEWVGKAVADAENRAYEVQAA